MLTASLSTSTRTPYHRTWKMLRDLSLGSVSLPIYLAVLCNSIAFLFANDYSPRSISSHTCVIGIIHKVHSIADPTEFFLVKKVLCGCHQLVSSKDTRLSNTEVILVILLNALDHTVQNVLHRLLLKCIFLLAFNAFITLGEEVVKSNQVPFKVIQKSDIAFEFK